MAAEAATKKIQSDVGTPSKTVKPKPLKDIIISYTNGVIRMELSTVRKWDDALQDFGPKEPQFYCMVAGSYLDMPKDSATLIDFGKALQIVGESIKGVQFGTPLSPELIVDAKSKLSEFVKGSV